MRFSPRFWIAVAAAYAAVFLFLALLGFYGFVSKTVLLPALFVAAALAGQFRVFVRDWAVFLSAVVLFDSARGLIYGLIVRYGLPVYMVYVLDWERTLLGGSTLPHLLQQAWPSAREMHILPRFFVVVHASHFLVFFFFALLVWLTRSAHFARFKLSLLMIMYLGLLGYLLAPTIPPWMAANQFEVMPPVEHMTDLVYNLAVPSLQAAFDLNHIAAMPSLHAAFPALFVLVAFYHYRWRGWPTLLYAILVFVGIAYLGEHYVVDILAGVVLAAFCYVVAYHAGFLREIPGFPRLLGAGHRNMTPATKRTFPSVSDKARLAPALLGTVVLLILAEIFGICALLQRRPFTPSRRFVDRELVGRSPMAELYLGQLAFSRGDIATGIQKMDGGVAHVTGKDGRRLLRYLQGQSRFQHRDLEIARRHLTGVPPAEMSPWDGLLRVLLEVETGNRREAFSVLDSLSAQATAGAEFQYWRARLEFETGKIGAELYQAKMRNLAERRPLAVPPVGKPQSDR